MTEYQKVTITMVRTKKYPKFNLLTNQWEWTTLLSQTGAKSTKKLYYSVNPGSTGKHTTGTPVQLYIWYYRQTVLFPIDVWHFPVNRINLFVDLLKVPNQTEQQLVYNQYIKDWFSFFLWTITLHSGIELSITITVCLLEVSKSTKQCLASSDMKIIPKSFFDCVEVSALPVCLSVCTTRLCLVLNLTLRFQKRHSMKVNLFKKKSFLEF